MRVGIDAGGTFTDLLGIDPLTSRVTVAKVPSSRDTPEAAVYGVLNEAAVSGSDVDITVGTTVATNARITRSGATVIYVTTTGFEDIPFIQWGARKEAFDPSWPKPDPGVMRRNCVGIDERINKSGEVVVPLADSALAALATAVGRRIRTHPDQQWAIALNLLFSYVNDSHEVRVARFLASEFPDIPVSISSVICPMWREYERATTVIADAYVKPALGRFIGQLGTGMSERGYISPLSIMKSNGGQMSAERAAGRAAEIFHSGLAGGVIGGEYHARLAGSENAVTLDMGGTSADVAVLPNCEHGSETVHELEWGDSAQHSARGLQHNWRGWRVDRLDRFWRHASRRASQRRSEAWPSLLRRRWHRTDCHRCESPSRTAEPQSRYLVEACRSIVPPRSGVWRS